MRETKLWTWHVLAGIAILILGGLHMVTMHLDGILGVFNPAGGLAIDWQNVVARAQTMFHTVVYIALLAVTLFHGFYGLRNIIAELGIGKGARSAVSVVLLVGGIGLFVFGTWAALASRALALG